MPGVPDGLSREELTAELGCSERTIVRWERLGLPVMRLGVRRWYDPASVREWLLSRARRHDRPNRARAPLKVWSRA